MAADATSPNTLKATGRRSTATGDVPDDLRRRYYLDGRGGLGLGFYADATIATPAFRDRGDRLVTSRTDPHVIRHLTAIARHRGWKRVTLTGAPDFRREAWLIARAEGLEVRGYRPTARDAQDLERRIEAQRRRQQWASLREDLEDARAHPDRERRRAGAASRLAVVDALVKSRIPDPLAQARLLDQARARVAGWLERGGGFDEIDLGRRPTVRRERGR